MRLVHYVIVALLLALAVPIAVSAAPNGPTGSAHFVKGSPTFTDDGTTLTSTGSLVGLGVDDLTVVLEATGVADVECRNPGGNVAPGQDTTVTTVGSVDDIEVKNGRAFYSVTTSEPEVANTPTCPNDGWTAEVVDVAFTSATLSFFQAGELVLTRTTSFGAVGAGTGAFATFGRGWDRCGFIC